MAGENTSVSLAANFQEVYSDEGLLDLVPDEAMLVREVKFGKPESATGGKFVQPVILSREHGFTYASSDDDAFALNGSVPMSVKRAELLGSQIVGQGRLGYEAAARAAKDKKAFVEATELLVENMMESAAYRLELCFLYGRTGIGTVNANTAASTTFVVSAATWAPSIWAGIEGATLTIVNPAFTNVKAQGVTVISVDTDETSGTFRQVTISAAKTLAIGDLVFFGGAVTGAEGGAGVPKECLGLDGILTTSTGSLFNIPVQTLWRGNSYDVGAGPLTITHINNAAKRARDRGLKESVKLLVSPKAWNGLVNPTIDPKDSSGSRKVDASYKSSNAEFGYESIKIHGPQGQNIEVVPHPYVKEGEAFMLPMKRLKRVGASDISFRTPGMRDEEMFIHLQTSAAYEFRCYANQAIFIDSPAKCVKLKNIA